MHRATITVLFNSLDRSLVPNRWVRRAIGGATSVDVTWVDCAGLPFSDDAVGVPYEVAAFASAINHATQVVLLVPQGPVGIGGVFETAMAWLSRKEICHVVRGKRLRVVFGCEALWLPDDWMALFERDLAATGARPRVDTAHIVETGVFHRDGVFPVLDWAHGADEAPQVRQVPAVDWARVA